MIRRWLPGLIAGVILSLFSLYPQFNLINIRGADYNGAFASCDLDEMAYASFLQALIDGRPRKSDPYTGRDAAFRDPQPESLFSIQFLPTYLSAIPAWLFGLNASQMMPVISVVSAFLTTLALYWLMLSMIDDPMIAAAGTMIVMVGSAAIVGLGAINGFFENGVAYPFFPFLRRPIPSLAFPFLFAFFACVWNGVNAGSPRSRLIYLAASVMLFTALVFSYFYLWTSAAAVLGGLMLFTVLFRSEEARRALAYFASIGILCVAALVPYAWLLSNRSKMADKAQLLVFTHSPDIYRRVEIIGVVALFLVVIVFWFRITDTSPRRLATIAALLLSPVLVFNQQILTGRAMQPYHYAAFVVNYTVLIGLLITANLWWKNISTRALVWLAALAFVWGFVEVGLPARYTTVPAAVASDQIVPVLRRLDALSNQDGTMADLRTKGRASTIVFSPELNVSVLLPAWTSQPTLLDIGGLDFGSLMRDVRKEYFYMHLYYASADMDALRQALHGNPADPAMNYYARAVLFGHERIVPALAGDFKPIQEDEIEREVRLYQNYADNFSREQALKRPLSYVITPADKSFVFANIDRWYERDSGERLGNYVLYRVKLKN